MTDKLLRINDVAAMTDTSVITWRHWIATNKEGIPKPAKLGKRLVWRESQIERWLDEAFAAANK